MAPPSADRRGALVFLHGSGGNGDDMKEWLELIQVPGFNESFVELLKTRNVEVYTPTANVLPYPPCGNSLMHVWFTRQVNWNALGCGGAEDLHHTDVSMDAIANLVDSLEATHDFVVLGGFSMGGCLGLHALRRRWSTKVKGVFAMGSFLVSSSQVLTGDLRAKHLPVLMMHGTDDDVTRTEYGAATAKTLVARGVAAQFKTYEQTAHTVSGHELSDLYEWLVGLASSLQITNATKT
ncbi:hypothetical protein H310_11361 [Aphanomyces invadans]|uniref:Phospholipase/carboxylesterase/thioesterase domain-containing protein n=1 Tax=Aphanomyces invadans TaxID=157072 RepID=A0A024TNZ1_9STRA|nr:hypothetical protein H310_11361 [Aphanomyces invadans]ETV95067.1 hypothetical protein H310_11361 [Aphanomyces invadans]|eukprot:XP_008876240.1 hypothetical protein H310_11361 [Aphanomyces invadans]